MTIIVMIMTIHNMIIVVILNDRTGDRIGVIMTTIMIINTTMSHLFDDNDYHTYDNHCHKDDIGYYCYAFSGLLR